MSFKSILLATACAISTVHAAGCYNGGAYFTSYSEAQYHVSRACYGYDGNRGAFQDVWFLSYETSSLPATACVNLNGGKSLVMQITNSAYYDRTISAGEAYAGLMTILNDCTYGGERQIQSAYFRYGIILFLYSARITVADSFFSAFIQTRP